MNPESRVDTCHSERSANETQLSNDLSNDFFGVLLNPQKSNMTVCLGVLSYHFTYAERLGRGFRVQGVQGVEIESLTGLLAHIRRLGLRV